MDYVRTPFLVLNYLADTELTFRSPKSMGLVRGNARCITFPSQLSNFYVT